MKSDKEPRVTWQVVTTRDAQERLELAFAMLFSNLGNKVVVDNSY